MSSSVYSASESKTFTNNSGNVKLVELYTSQGCSSCPPAERWISNLKHDKRLWKTIFPVAFHVDYWDYIGWKDEFAEPAYGKRQRLYQYLGNVRQVATPGFVVGGSGWNGWFRGQRLASASSAIDSRGTLIVELKGSEVLVKYESETKEALPQSYKINVAILGFDLVSKIDAGENLGRNLSQDFVVQMLNSAFLDADVNQTDNGSAKWQGRLHLSELQSEPSQKKAVVAWISYGNNPAPIQVTGGWL